MKILMPLKRVEALNNHPSALRLRTIITEVLRYATARAEIDPTFCLTSAFIALNVSHRAAVTDWATFCRLLKSFWN